MEEEYAAYPVGGLLAIRGDQLSIIETTARQFLAYYASISISRLSSRVIFIAFAGVVSGELLFPA